MLLIYSWTVFKTYHSDWYFQEGKTYGISTQLVVVKVVCCERISRNVMWENFTLKLESKSLLPVQLILLLRIWPTMFETHPIMFIITRDFTSSVLIIVSFAEHFYHNLLPCLRGDTIEQNYHPHKMLLSMNLCLIRSEHALIIMHVIALSIKFTCTSRLHTVKMKERNHFIDYS